MSKQDPVSVVLPATLRKRIASEAKRRGLKLSPTLRALAMERLEELAHAEQLTRAAEWQRAQAWATWAQIEEGDRREVSRNDLQSTVARFARRSRKR